MRVERDGLTGSIIIHPDDGIHSATVVIMHGLGDSSEGFGDVAQMLSSSMPYVKFILPTASARPVSLNGGSRMNAWYDIVGLTAADAESVDGIDESVDTIHAILEKEASLGLPYSRMALAGFSQGGAMTLFTGLQLPVEKKLAGLVVMSGYLPGAGRFKLTPGLEDTPILHCHGTSDMVVMFGWGEKTRDGVIGFGATAYEFKSYAGVGHSVSPKEISDVQKFLSTIVPDDPSFAVKPKDPSEMSLKELREAIKRNGLGSKSVGLTEKSEFVQLLKDHLNK